MGLGPAELSFTVLPGQPIPPQKFPRWAVLGRSNVGKSSLLNALLHPKEFFRTGSRAGVTIGAVAVKVQVHSAKNAFLELIDLPGFGYAERSKALTRDWSQMVEDFRAGSDTRYLTWVWLIDPRREPDEMDFEVLKWLGSEKMILAFTKADKVKPKERGGIEKAWKKMIEHSTERVIWSSALNGEGFDQLQKSARAFVRDYCETV